MTRLSALLATLLLSLAALSAAPVPPAEKLLPTDTLLLVTVPDWDHSHAAWNAAPLVQLWNDPSMRPFREHFWQGYNKDVTESLEKNLGIRFADFTNLIHGQFTVAVVQNGWQGQTNDLPGVVVLADVKEHVSKLEKVLNDLKKKWLENGRQFKEDTIHGVKFTILLVSADEIGKSLSKSVPGADKPDAPADDPDAKKSPPTELYIGQNGSLLLIGNSPKVLEKVLVQQNDTSASGLSEQPAFESAYNALFREATAYVWVNTKAFSDILMQGMAAKEATTASPLGASPSKIMTALGLTGLRSISVATSNSREGTMIQLLISVRESDRRGLVKILAIDAKDAAPPAFVPADVTKFSRWRLDGQKTWSTLESLMAEVYPPISGILQMTLDMAGKDKDPNFDLRKSLIGNLGDDVVTLQKPPRDSTPEAIANPPSLTLIGSPRAEQLLTGFRAGAAALLPQTGSGPTEREFRGHKIYAVALPPQTSSGSAPQARTLSYASSGGYLAMSTDPALVEEYLRSSESTGRSLRELPGFAEAAEKVGGMGTGIFGYENETEVARATFQLLKTDPKAFDQMMKPSNPLLGAASSGANDKQKDWFDFSLLPPFEKLEKYLGYSVYSGSVTPEGILFRSFLPTPPQLRK